MYNHYLLLNQLFFIDVYALLLILNLLSDFSYCYHRWDSAYLFSEIDNDIKLNSQWKEGILKDYKFHLNRIIENYNLKKEYLEIFKN